MRRVLLCLVLFVSLMLCSCSSTKQIATDVRQYSVETMGVGNDGTYLIKMTNYFNTTNENVYLDGLKRDAVHCVIYSGIPAGNGSINQPPLMTNDTRIDGNEEALSKFFENKLYLNYINSVVHSSKTITRIKGSKDYRISVVMSVNKDDLRNYLIDNKIIKPLNYIF